MDHRGWRSALVFWIVSGSESLQGCIHQSQEPKPYDTLYESVADFGILGGRLKPCIGVFIGENGETITALFTVVLGFSTIGLWLQTKRLAEGADDQSKKMVAAINATLRVSARTKDVAEAMDEAASAMRSVAAHTERLGNETARNAKLQLRAYVHVASAQVHYNSNKPTDCYIVVIMKNYGQTPALGVISTWGEHVREWPLASILPDLPPGIRKSNSPLPPGRDSIQRVSISSLNAQEEAELLAGRAGIYFWGTVTYTDIYGHTHQTRTRLVCEGEGLRKGLMHATEEGNDAD